MSNSNGGIGSEEIVNFARQVALGRWFFVFASFLIMTGAGGTYLFAFYSNDIKAVLKSDQKTLNTISFYKDLGANVGIFAGLLAEVAPSWFVLLVGAAMNFIGHFKIWQFISKRINNQSVGFVCFYLFIGANSQNFANTAVLVTSVKNFPERRGVILGLLKGFVGLSGAIMAQIHLAFYGEDTKSLVLLIGWMPSLISFVFAHAIREIKVEKHPHEFRVFFQFLCISNILAIFLMVITILQRHAPFSHSTQVASVTALLALLFLPLLIAIREELVLWKLKKEDVCNPFKRIRAEVPQSPQTLQVSCSSSSITQEPKQSTSFFQNIFNKPERGEDYTILQAIFSVDMMLIFITMLTGVGSGLTFIDNLGQIGKSLHYPPETINSFVSLFSIFNFAGRIFSGFLSEILLMKYKFPRPLLLTLIQILSSISLLLIAIPFTGSNYIATVVTGFSLGSQVPLIFAIISEIFGLKHFSTLFNIGQLACPVGSYLLNVMITGSLYDRGAKIAIRDSVTNECIGAHCYSGAFLILATLTLFGALVSMILVRRTSEFYKGDIYEKFKEDLDTLKTEVVFYPTDERKKMRIGNLLVDKHDINYVR